MKSVVIAAILCTGFIKMTGQVPCENGFAGIYPCENVDLLYFMTPSQYGLGSTNEVWGWTDPEDSTEYVLLGKSNGTAFIDITNPLAPIYLGTLPPHTSNSIWRSLRVYNNYLFTVSEASGHGMQVFDLTKLRDVVNPPVSFTEDAWYNGFGKCHSLAICEETGYAYACGTNTFAGGLHIVNIQNPLAPVIAGSYDDDGYTHEAVVQVYNGPDPDYIGHTIAFCFNGNNPASLTLVDVTDPTDAHTVSITNYTNGEYCHQGWLTSDGAYLLMDDELDEYGGPYTQTRTLIWDMHDLDAPIYEGDHLGPTTAIDHNQMFVGNLDFQSNYTAGLRILDITDIADLQLTEVALFDNYPSTNAPVFDGTWMNYPFFASGIVPLTDIDNGLFLLSPNFLHLDADFVNLCSYGTAVVGLDLAEGFAGPVHLNASGLPVGMSLSFSANDVTSPSAVDMTLAATAVVPGTYTIDIEAAGAHFTYHRTLSVVVAVATGWFADTDGDGFGGGSVFLACSQPAGYVTNNTDCDDAASTIHPGATGTHLNIDNDCNGVVEGDEVLCPDLTGDGFINISDLLVFISYFGCSGNCNGDFDDNGSVNSNDLLIFMSVFGNICPQ